MVNRRYSTKQTAKDRPHGDRINRTIVSGYRDPINAGIKLPVNQDRPPAPPVQPEQGVHLAFGADVLTVWAKSGRIAHTVRADEILEVELRKLPLLSQLTVLTKLGRTITVNGLERGTSERLHSQLQTRVEEILNDEATRKASALGPRITDLRNSITSFLAPDRFIRHSRAAYMTRSTKELAEQLDERSRQKLTTKGKQALR